MVDVAFSLRHAVVGAPSRNRAIINETTGELSMKTIRKFAITSLASCLALSNALAQTNGRPPVAPVEIYGCQFVNGAGMDEFMRVAERWTRWANERGVTDYTALLMTPFFYSNQATADVLWLGAWPTGDAMGEGPAGWLTPAGAEIVDAFGEVVDCETHLSLAAVNIRPPSGLPAAGGMTMFRDCRLHDGRIAEDAFAAVREWTDFSAEHGVTGPTWVALPMAGERDDADYDFKIVSGVESPQALGASYEFIIAGGGVQRANQIMGRVMDCDSPRICAMNPVRVPTAD